MMLSDVILSSNKLLRALDLENTEMYTSMRCYIFLFIIPFTPLLLDPFYHYLITLLQGHMTMHVVAL